MCVCTIENMERKSRNRPEPLSQSQKHRRQAGDIILKEVMTWVSRGEKPRRQLLRGRPADLQAYWNIWEMLKIRDGVLYRAPLEGGAEHLGKPRWCVPTNLVTDALLVAHVEEGSHMAGESTLNREVQLTLWPTQRQDVADFCAVCPGCKSKTGPPKPHRPPWHQPMLQSRKNEVLYCDTVGLLHQAESGDTYMFTTLDGFTRYSTATPVPNKKATTMAACLKSYVNVWGAPEKLFCDEEDGGRPEDYQDLFPAILTSQQ